MVVNEEILQREIKIMKMSIAKLVREKDKEYIGTIEKFNQMVVLAVADFKCQKPGCGSENDLQIHHLIMRPAKEYMDFWRYASQRFYWANQIVLCKNHHRNYHEKMGGHSYKKDDEGGVISKKRINEIKKFFKDEENIMLKANQV